jgi:hypothetical protein
MDDIFFLQKAPNRFEEESKKRCGQTGGRNATRVFGKKLSERS